MSIRYIYPRSAKNDGSRSYGLTIPKDDLDKDGLLSILEELDESIPVWIERTGAGAWSVEIMEDRLSEEAKSALARETGQLGFEDVEAD